VKLLADLAARSGLAANPLILPLALLYGLVLAAVTLSLAALVRARALVRDATQTAQADFAQCQAAVNSIRQELIVLSAHLGAQLQEVRIDAAPAGLPRPGLNLSKRSQALRMHRRGDAPAEIASALGVPLQEIDLLLKVHRIVISKI
jgi:hypothetical protein